MNVPPGFLAGKLCEVLAAANDSWVRFIPGAAGPGSLFLMSVYLVERETRD